VFGTHVGFEGLASPRKTFFNCAAELKTWKVVVTSRATVEPPDEAQSPRGQTLHLDGAEKDEANEVNAMMGLVDEEWQEKPDECWDSSANNFIRQIKTIIANQPGAGPSEPDKASPTVASSYPVAARGSRLAASISPY